MENQETPCLRCLLAWHQIEHNCGLKHSHDGRKPTSAFYFQITNSGCHGSLSEGWQRFPNHMHCISFTVSTVFATVVQLQMKKLGIADVTVHYQEIGTWQMIPSSFPKVWRILDVFLPLFCFPKQEGESLRFFWRLGRGKKCWDAEVRSGPVAISREKKTHPFSSFSLCRSKTRRSWANSFRVSHQHWQSRDHHQNEFQVFEIHGHLPERKELGQLPEKKMHWRNSLLQIFF